MKSRLAIQFVPLRDKQFTKGEYNRNGSTVRFDITRPNKYLRARSYNKRFMLLVRRGNTKIEIQKLLASLVQSI